MARVTITLVDKPHGEVDCAADFDPPAQRDEGATPAQHAAMVMLAAAMKAGGRSKAKVKKRR